MQSQAKTVKGYLKELPEDRRAVVEAIRKVICESKDDDIEEGMQYGMIGYFVPHRVFPAGYHCDPRQPLPYACVGSQKNHVSISLMFTYFANQKTSGFRTSGRRQAKSWIWESAASESQSWKTFRWMWSARPFAEYLPRNTSA